MFKASSDQHQVIAGGVGAPSLADLETLKAPDGVSLTANLDMAWGDCTELRVVLVILFGTYHPTALEMKEVHLEIM